MKRFAIALAASVLVLLATVTFFSRCASAAAAAAEQAPSVTAKATDPYDADYKLMSGVLLFAINDKAVAVVFVSTGGKTAAFSAKECQSDDECNALVQRAIKDHKVEVLNVPYGQAV
jgi:hypothetical protein